MRGGAVRKTGGTAERWRKGEGRKYEARKREGRTEGNWRNGRDGRKYGEEGMRRERGKEDWKNGRTGGGKEKDGNKGRGGGKTGRKEGRLKEWKR